MAATEINSIEKRELSECTECGLSFGNVVAHKLVVHDSNPVNRCTFCGVLFTDSCFLVDHLIDDHGDRPDVKRCYICRWTGDDVLQLWTHLDAHRETHLYSCDSCRRTTSTTLGLASHSCSGSSGKPRRSSMWRVVLRRSRNVEERTCNMCNLEFKSRKKLSDHTYLDHISIKCPICKKRLRSKHNLVKHMSVKHKPGAYKVNIKTKAMGHVYNSSMSLECKEMEFECGDCGTKRMTKGRLREHINDCHMGPYTCDECDKPCQTMGSLRSHKLFHTGGLDCQYCGIHILRKWSIQSHINGGHNSCEFCSEVHPCKEMLRRHINEEHALVCPKCDSGKAFSTIETYRCHMSREHRIGYCCRTCGFSCGSLYNLKRHERRTHGIRYLRNGTRVQPHNFQIKKKKKT